MAFIEKNANPNHKLVGDCVVRAIATILGIDWETAYTELVLQGLMMSDMPSANAVWGVYLKGKGFKRSAVSNSCPECYTIRDFASEHSTGKYIVAGESHIVAVINGDYYDTWDSGDEFPIYYWFKEA